MLCGCSLEAAYSLHTDELILLRFGSHGIGACRQYTAYLLELLQFAGKVVERKVLNECDCNSCSSCVPSLKTGTHTVAHVASAA